MKVCFSSIRFVSAPGGGVFGVLHRFFRFFLSDESLLSVGSYVVVDGCLVFSCHEKKRTRFMQLLGVALRSDLVCTITGNPSVYIDSLSGVPLQGSLEFGIIDRGTNLIEIRPMSGCNLQCTYCSVSEGPGGVKVRDFVVEPEYFLSEFAKVASVKSAPLEVFIETQGEPTLYWQLPELISELKKRDDVVKVTMVTNGTFLSPSRIDAYVAAGLDQINWSINSLDPSLAEEIAGMPYDVERTKRAVVYASDKIDCLVCPVIMRGVNEHEMESFVEFGLSVRSVEPVVGFQNFLFYKGGRNPVEEVGWDGFTEKILELEKQFGTRLKLGPEDFSIVEDAQLPKPFKKRDVVEVERLFPGRLPNETLCKASDRVVKVIGRVPDKEKFFVRIIRDKHNIFFAKAL
ncbi:MAG: radical SAM protein [Candidatus Woesearchaeota archaeon]